MRKSLTGFTLIECLIALFIVAIVMASSSRAIGVISSDLRDTFVIEAATWVAGNEYNEMRITNTFPDIGVQKKDATMANMDFIVTETVSNTQNPYFRKVEIAIAEKNTPDNSIFRTINFIAQY
jgi:general secretion pathway protein I